MGLLVLTVRMALMSGRENAVYLLENQREEHVHRGLLHWSASELYCFSTVGCVALVIEFLLLELLP